MQHTEVFQLIVYNIYIVTMKETILRSKLSNFTSSKYKNDFDKPNIGTCSIGKVKLGSNTA